MRWFESQILRNFVSSQPPPVDFTESYNIKLLRGGSYFNTLPNYTLSYNIAKLYPILVHCRTVLYLDTMPKYTWPNALPNYTPFYYIAELDPTSTDCRTIANLITMLNYTLS